MAVVDGDGKRFLVSEGRSIRGMVGVRGDQSRIGSETLEKGRKGILGGDARHNTCVARKRWEQAPG